MGGFLPVCFRARTRRYRTFGSRQGLAEGCQTASGDCQPEADIRVTKQSLRRSGAVPRRCIAKCRVDAPPLSRARYQPPRMALHYRKYSEVALFA
jgi:hypothetical protein